MGQLMDVESADDAIVRVIREAEEDLRTVVAGTLRLRIEARAFREIQKIVNEALQKAGG